MIVKNREVTPTPAGERVQRKVLAADGSLMLVEVSFQQGSVGAVHRHPHEQVSYVAKGRVEVELEGRKEIVQAGDSFYAGSNQAHGVKALEETVLIDIFTPQREDFKASK